MPNGATMLIMDIYQKRKKIESKAFLGHFYILTDYHDGSIFWKTGKETKSKHGIIRVWIQPVDGYRILYVLPDWQLKIDGVQLPQKFYDTVNVTGKCISLRYGDYEFVCQFPEVD
jgi:hypothetical protein